MEIVKYFYSRPEESKNRITICGIFDTETKTMTFGASRCSKQDSFKKDFGRKIAYGRAQRNPYLETDVLENEKISDVFRTNCLEICEEIKVMPFPRIF